MFEAFVITLIFFVVFVLGYAVGYGKAVDDHMKERLGKEAANLIKKGRYDDPGVGWPTAEALRKAGKQFPAHRRPRRYTGYPIDPERKSDETS